MSLPFRTVRRLMQLRQAPVHAVAPSTPVVDAARLMERERKDGLAVVDQGAFVGVLAGRDIVRAVAAGRSITELRVAETMVPTDVHATPATTLPQCLALLADHGLNHLAVLDDGRVVDLLSETDLLRELADHHHRVVKEKDLQEFIMHLQGVYSC